MFCADPNPWDPSLLCGLEHDHEGLHEARWDDATPNRWAEYCHFPGDGCGPFAHADRLEDAG